MKIKRIKPLSLMNEVLKKYVRIMKLTCILIVVLTLQASANAWSQNSLSVKMQNSSLLELFTYIENNSDYKFFYNNDEIDVKRKISLEVKDKTIDHVLNEAFKEIPYSYKEMGNQLILIETAKENHKIFNQQKNISGTVSDSFGLTLPGVSIVIKGTTTGTVSDFDGNFKLANVPGNATLVFSFVGMKSQEINIAGQTTFSIVMEEDAIGVGEVVVTALGIKRETKTIGYSIQSISAQVLEDAPDINIVNSLAGKIAGVQINQSSGGADGSSSIIIRGQNSLLGNNQPLFVIDGIIVDNNQFNASDNGFDYGNGISDLNAEDFESISVLKGPNAAALYGARAANGVIIITSKKGGKSKGLGISVSSTMMWENPYQLKDFQNVYGSGGSPFWEDYPTKDGVPVLNVTWNNFGPKMDGTEVIGYDGNKKTYLAQPNNIIDFYKQGFSAVNNVAISGGNDDGSSAYRFSLTSREKSSTIPTNRADKYNVSFNGQQKLNNVLSAKVNTNYIKSFGKNRPRVGNSGNAWDYHSGFFPRDISTQVYQENYKKDDGAKQNACPWCYNNAFWEINENSNIDEGTRFIGGIELQVDICEELDLTLKANTDNDSRHYERKESGVQAGGVGGLYSVSQTNRNQLTYEFLLSWNKELSNKLNLSLNAGGQSWASKSTSTGGRTDGNLQVPNFFSLSNSSRTPVANSGIYEKEINSLYGFGQIAYNDYLFIDFTARNDWSSTLATDNNSYFYPSISTGFVFTEAFGMGKSIIDFGKIRTSWAKVGKDTEAYQLFSTYGAGQPYGSYPTVNTPTNALLPGIKPEITTSFEIGGNLIFAGNRINMDFSYYQSSSKNQIIPLPVSNASGISSTLINAGEVENKGFELMLNLMPVKTKNFRWDMTFNYSKNKNKVVELADGVETLELRRNGDGPVIVEARPGKPYGDILIRGIERNSDGLPIINGSGHYIQKGTFEVAGNIQPDWTGGLINDFKYKNWRLHSLIDFSMGGELYSYSTRWISARGSSVESLWGRDKEHGGVEWIDGNNRTRNDGIILDGVTESGEKNTRVISALNYYNTSYQNDFASHMQSASYIMFRELSLNYTIPKRIIDKLSFIQSVRLGLIGRNLGFILNDSEILNATATAYGSSNGSKGVETGSHPASRIWGFNVNVKF